MTVLIDTNLLIYLFDESNPSKQSVSKKVLDYLHSTRQGRLSVQSLSEFVSVSTRKLTPALTMDQAKKQISLLANSFTVLDLTFQVVYEAVRGVREHQLAFYDAQIWAIARLNQIQVIFSEDFQDNGLLEGVRFINPFSEGFQEKLWLP